LKGLPHPTPRGAELKWPPDSRKTGDELCCGIMTAATLSIMLARQSIRDKTTNKIHKSSEVKLGKTRKPSYEVVMALIRKVRKQSKIL
jgi:hypothetical protein